MPDNLARQAIVDAPQSEPAPLPQTGEIVLTPGQKIALLKMRRSDWTKAVLAHLEAFGAAEVCGEDYRALARIGLAESRGAYHVRTPLGRWRADRVAVELARGADMHVITYNLFPRHGSAASARCSCGWSAFRTRAVSSYVLTLGQDAQHHLKHVGGQP